MFSECVNVIISIILYVDESSLHFFLGIFAPLSKICKPGILVNSRSPGTPRHVNHKRIDTSHVGAKVDTG